MGFGFLTGCSGNQQTFEECVKTAEPEDLQQCMDLHLKGEDNLWNLNKCMKGAETIPDVKECAEKFTNLSDEELGYINGAKSPFDACFLVYDRSNETSSAMANCKHLIDK